MRDVKAEALIDTLSDTLSEVVAKTIVNTMADLKAEALLNAVAETRYQRSKLKHCTRLVDALHDTLAKDGGRNNC